MENVRKRRYQAGSKKEMFGISEIPQPKYHTTTFFSEYLLAVEIKKTQIWINQSIYVHQY